MPGIGSAPARGAKSLLAMAAGLVMAGCVVTEGPMVVTRSHEYGYAVPDTYAYGYGRGQPVPYGWGEPVYRARPAPPPRVYAPYGPRYGYADPFSRPGRRGSYASAYRNNGRCDDPRYETSHGGRARPGSDDYDCSRFGNGLKGRYR
jgi:hypothetical protein